MMRVLLVDERSWSRSALHLLIEWKINGQVVGEVDDVASLPDVMQSLHPDLILLDRQLPGMDEPTKYRQLISVLRSLQPQIYIIVLVSRPEENSRYALLGADALVSKAESPDCLQAALLLAEQTIVAQGRRTTSCGS
jgi:DNA-binding NarL/FixJ family response regulator